MKESKIISTFLFLGLEERIFWHSKVSMEDCDNEDDEDANSLGATGPSLLAIAAGET